MSGIDVFQRRLQGLRRFAVRIRTFIAMPGRDKLLLGEAMVALTAASLVIAMFPFRIVVRLAQGPAAHASIPAQARPLLHNRVRWAILVCARRLPWRAMCFPQGLAAQWMLRRRGIPSVLHYGAARNAEGELIAHVWVCDGEIAVIGGEAAAGVALLAKFPSDRPSIAGSPP